VPNIGPVEVAMVGLVIVTFVGIPVAIVLLVIRLLRSTSGQRPPETDHAVEIVRVRFARGEITREEFEAALLALGRASPRGRGSAPPPPTG
jgi:uncharacterized membrane protein